MLTVASMSAPRTLSGETALCGVGNVLLLGLFGVGGGKRKS
jgi:hypothetical protein